MIFLHLLVFGGFASFFLFMILIERCGVGYATYGFSEGVGVVGFAAGDVYDGFGGCPCVVWVEEYLALCEQIVVLT